MFKKKALFPRTCPNDESTVDTGSVCGNETCPDCESPEYICTVSLEFCATCGSFVDYWGNTNKFKGHPDLIARAKLIPALQKELQNMVNKFVKNNHHLLSDRVILKFKGSHEGKEIIFSSC